VVVAASITIYPGGGRLCLSACPGDGKVKKIAVHPLRIISGTALKKWQAYFNGRQQAHI